MNFNKSGWLRQYISFRKEVPFQERLPTTGLRMMEDNPLHHPMDEAVYFFLQPTGLLYGFPVTLPYPHQKYPNFEFMANQDRVYLIYLEALFSCLVADRHYVLDGLDLMEDHFQSAVEAATNFNTLGFRESRLKKLFQRPLGIKDNAHTRMEGALRAHLGRTRDLVRLTGEYHNSFLFLEIFGTMQWQRRMLADPHDQEDHQREITAQQMAFRETMVRLMIAAAWSSDVLDKAQRRLIEWFLRSSDLPPAKQKELRGEISTGISLEEIAMPDAPWLVRRFMLEAILVTILIDQDITPGEDRYLADVVEKLDLWEGELNQSMTAIEVFMLHHQERLHFFKTRSSLWNVRDNLTNRAQVILSKNIQRLTKEVKETRELYDLLMKSRTTTLTSEEKAKVRAQIMDILKTIPALTIFALPGGGVILPLIIKLLPFNLLPSAFED